MTVLASLSRTTVDALSTVSVATNVITSIIGAADTGASALNAHAKDYLEASRINIGNAKIKRAIDASVDMDEYIYQAAHRRGHLDSKLGTDANVARIYNEFQALHVEKSE